VLGLPVGWSVDRSLWYQDVNIYVVVIVVS